MTGFGAIIRRRRRPQASIRGKMRETEQPAKANDRAVGAKRELQVTRLPFWLGGLL